MDKYGYVEAEFFKKSFAEQVSYFEEQLRLHGEKVFLLPPEPDVTLISCPDRYMATKLLAYSAEVPNQIIHTDEDADKWAEKVMSGLSIPVAMEMIDFSFLIRGCSRVFTHQMVRHRAASISQSTSRNRVLAPIFVCPVYDRWSYWENYFTSTYRDYIGRILDGYEPQDARYALPDAIAQSMVFRINFRALQQMMSQRLCLNMQPEMSFVAWSMKMCIRGVMSQIADKLRPACDKVKQCLPVQCDVYESCGKWPATKESKTGKHPISHTQGGRWVAIRELFFSERE